MLKTLSSIIFPLITFPYVSRVLHPENYGIYNFSASIVSYFSILATLGITAYAVRECSQVKNNKKVLEQTASEILSLNVCATAFSYVALILCLIWIPKFQSYGPVIGILSANILFTVVGADWMNTVMEDFRYITIRTVAFQALALVLMLICIHQSTDYVKYAVITVIAAGGGQLSNVFYRRRFCRIRFTFKINWKKHLPPVLILFAMLISQTILNNIDITMIGFIKSDTDVGLYSAAVKVTSIINQVIASVCWVVLPQLSQGFANKDYKRINQILHRTLVFTITLTLPCVAGLCVLSPEILTIVGGAEYALAAPCLCILAIGMIIAIGSNIFGNMILLPSNREMQFTIACAAGMLVNAILNTVIIPRFGINGAAVATLLATIIISAVTMINPDPRLIFNGIPRTIIGPIIGSIVIVLIGLFVRYLELGLWLGTFVAVFFSVTAYALILIIAKNEIALEIVNPLLNKIKVKTH